MDKNDHIYAEFVFQTMKRKPRNLASTVAEYTHDSFKNSSVKELHNFDHIFEYLSELSLVSIEYNSTGRGRPQALKLTSIGNKTQSVEARLQKLKYDEYNALKRKEKEEGDKASEVEYFKRQNWLAKYWWFTTSVSALVGAVIGMLVQKFVFC
jgi:hypothetical protein